MPTAPAHRPRENPAFQPRLRFRSDGEGGFRSVVTTRVDAHFAATGQTRHADASIYAKATIFAAVTVTSYALLLGNAFGAPSALTLAIIYGLSTLFLAMNVSHDAAHVALTGNRRLDSAIHRVLFCLLGVDGYLWQLRHDGSHHVFPNVNGSDMDIDENPFLRLSPNHPWRPRHRGQHFYAPLVYALTLVHSIFFSDVAYLFKRRLANMRDIRHKPADVVIFILAKLFYFTVNLLLPVLLIRLPWWQVLAGYAVMTAAMSLVFVFLLIGTHFSSEARYPAPNADGRLASSWAEHVLDTSVDWLPQSRIAGFFAGGANAHAAHHLFPRVSHRHNSAITGIVRDTAREFGLRYNETDFCGAIRLHFRHLWLMSRPESAQRDLHRERGGDHADGRVHVAPAA